MVNAMVGQDTIAMTGVNVNSSDIKTNSLGQAVVQGTGLPERQEEGYRNLRR